MIVRSWLVFGTLLTAVAWVLTVTLSPPPYQASPGGFADTFRAENRLPKVGNFKISEEIEHDVFEVPEGDAAQLAAAVAAAGAEVPAAMPGMAMDNEKDEEERMGGSGIMAVSSVMPGMKLRTVEIEMSEWSFKPARVEVTAGETIRFVLRNTGKMPHEFMFMRATEMQAVTYRLERADWNLTEHESIFEQAVILPGDSLEATLMIAEPGSWMFMCMFPYHMQFGMMGTMMTEGAAMPAMNMGGMKM